MALYFFSGAILIFGAILLSAAFSGSKEIITFPFSSTGYSSNGEEFFGGFSSSSGSGYGTLHHDDIYAKETSHMRYDARVKEWVRQRTGGWANIPNCKFGRKSKKVETSYVDFN